VDIPTFTFVPFAGDNSTTLNFSVLYKNNSNINTYLQH